MRSDGADTRFLADLVAGVLSGEDVRERFAPETRIDPLPRCIACVERVMAGLRPLETVEALRRADEAGHFSWRRARRATSQG